MNALLRKDDLLFFDFLLELDDDKLLCPNLLGDRYIKIQKLCVID